MADKKKRQSPYRRHNKQPYLYSAELRAWRDAVRRNDPRGIREHREAWLLMMRRRAWREHEATPQPMAAE